MNSAITRTRILSALPLCFVIAASPVVLRAQTGKWIGTISQLRAVTGAADITVEPRNEKQSKVKVSIRTSKKEQKLAWDVVAGTCSSEGASIAPLAAFPPIQLGMDGSGSATANVTKLVEGKPYYVRVFDPQTAVTDASAYGCANLAEKP